MLAALQFPNKKQFSTRKLSSAKYKIGLQLEIYEYGVGSKPKIRNYHPIHD